MPSILEVRDWMNKNPQVMLIVVGVLLLFSFVYLLYQCVGGGSGTQPKVWYFDLGAKELVVGDPNGVPPLTDEEGRTLVRAHVYSCGDCTDDQWFIGYIERYTPEAREEVIKRRESGTPPDEEEGMLEREGKELSDDKGETWFTLASIEGEDIQNLTKLRERCNDEGGKLRYCRPPR